MASSDPDLGPDLAPLRARFPALARTQDGVPVVFADAPGGSQLPDSVIESVAGRLRAGASNMDGSFLTSREIGDTVAAARAAAADLVGAAPERIVFGANATSLLFSFSRAFAATLRSGDEVVVSRLDHDANVRPWVLAARDAGATVRWIDVDPRDATLDVDSFHGALGERTRLVAFTLASNAVGSLTPAPELVRAAKAVGALVVLDGVHIAQHRAIDLDALDADLLAVSPYKVFGPHLGFVAATPAVLDGWDPYRVRPAAAYPSPQRWETGTQNHEGLAGLNAAVDYLAAVGRIHGRPGGPGRRAEVVAAFDAIVAHEAMLSRRFLSGLASIDGARLVGLGPDDVARRTPTFALRIAGLDPHAVAASLGERGIFVWDGHQYAIELFDRLDLLGSGGVVRVGFCHYHTPGEVDRVLAALADLR